MDNFMDKVAQKLNSQEIIRANAAADAAALENLEKQLVLFKEQMDKYDDCLQEMRKLNLKNIESAQGVQALADKVKSLTRQLGKWRPLPCQKSRRLRICLLQALTRL